MRCFRGQLVDRTSSDLHQKQMEELGGDKDPCRALDQEADRQDPHGDQSQTGRLDLDHGEGNRPEPKHPLFIQNFCLEATN